MNIIKIGVIGYSMQEFDKQKAIEYLKKAFDFIEKQNPDRKKTVIAGLTDLGIPALAYREAKRRSWRVEGIACSKALDYIWFSVSNVTIVSGNWGDESETFLKAINILVRIGGGEQSMREVKMAKKMRGIDIMEYDLQGNKNDKRENKKSYQSWIFYSKYISISISRLLYCYCMF